MIDANFGGVLLSNGTLFRNITGVAIFVGAATVVYLLPAPVGRYLPSASVKSVSACWQ